MEEKNKKAVEEKEQAAAPIAEGSAASTEDYEAKIAALEAEKAKIAEERDNYKTGLLKEKGKHAGKSSEGSGDETEDERLRIIAREELANSRLAEIAEEQDVIIRKALKENKELKLASMNKPETAASVGAHAEETAKVTSKLVTTEQENYFRNTLKWSDKDIERYKKNLGRNGVR